MTEELQIFNYFGTHAQARKLNEEAYEFCETVLYQDVPNSLQRKLKIGEMADVLLVLEQFRQKENITHEELNAEILYKKKRTLYRIEIGYYERKEEI